MKVICIKEPDPNKCSHDAPISISILKVGEYYSVLGVYPSSNPFYIQTLLKTNNEFLYELEEHIGYLYNSILFAQVSEIDETKMERDYSRVDQSLFVKKQSF